MLKVKSLKPISLNHPSIRGWHFLIVSKDIVSKFGFEGKFKRVVCTINGGDSFQCALLPWGEMFYIIVNKKKRDALSIVGGDTVDVLLEKDESKYGLPMPEEVEEVLKQDADGDKLFHALTAVMSIRLYCRLKAAFSSSTVTVRIEAFGLTGDTIMPGDWDGDGKADVATYREGSQSSFYYRGPINNPGGATTFLPRGIAGDKAVRGHAMEKRTLPSLETVLTTFNTTQIRRRSISRSEPPVMRR